MEQTFAGQGSGSPGTRRLLFLNLLPSTGLHFLPKFMLGRLAGFWGLLKETNQGCHLPMPSPGWPSPREAQHLLGF